ncbi:MAG: hypothetical protein OZ928_08120 [Polyangiaceae bacterium]|nr:hypothetical protein [Polyangiaceae bacterium]
MAIVFETGLGAAGRVHEDRQDADRWYVGISDDPLRILEDHDVDPAGSYRYAECASVEVARSARAHLVAAGYLCSPDVGDEHTVWVYVYRITSRTRQ